MSKPKLLSGGNPQIPKGEGDAPVQAYIAAMPDWKREAGEKLDTLIENTVPGVRKAVKWNSPFFGMAKDCWFLSFHCYDRFVKISFYKGAELSPPPEVTSKYPAIRYHHVHDPALGADELGGPFADWVRQASELPGVKM